MSDADKDVKSAHDDEKKTSEGGGSQGDDREETKQDKSGEDEAGNGNDEDDGDAPAKKPSIFSKPLFWIILIVVVALLVIGAVLYWLHARQYESTDDAFVDAHIVRIAPQVSGKLIAIADADNRHVDAGRLLAVIDPGSTGSQLEQARADVIQARAQVAQAQAQVRANLATEAQAAVQARGPLAAAQKAAADLERYRTLLRIDPNAVAGQQFDQARSTARSTAADAAAARKQVDTAAANVTVARKAVGAAQAVIVARQAAIDQAKVTIGYLRLTAPVSGQVVNRSVNLGSYVAPGTQLMAIVPDKLWVTANFKETQLTNMRIGQGVAIHVDAYPGIDFLGHVDSIQRGAGQAFALLPPQNATGNYVKVVQRVPVRILFDIKNGPDPRHYPIGPGMSVVPTVKVR